MLSLSVVLLATGCSDDIAPEITALDTDQLFSPVSVTAKVVNQTGVRLTWNSNSQAESYEIEILQGGATVKTVNEITNADIPYTITGLDGETQYTAQVKAMAAGKIDSRYSVVEFQTDAEQIFKAIDPNELKATEATLRWTAGEKVTEIVVTPGDLRHTVTANEMAAGAATITGLVGETTYTARLVNGTKTRGTAVFTTVIDLGSAIKVEPTDDLAAMLSEASAGDVFALMPGTYSVATLNVKASIAIKGARPNDRPILKGTIIRLSEGAGLNLKDLILDGTESSGDQAIIYDADGTYGSLVMDACDIKNYVKGTMYVNTKALIESMTITNCIYSEIECNGGDFIDFRSGIAKTFTFKNNTAYNSANTARDFFRMDDGGSTNFPGIVSLITIENNTFFNVSNKSDKRMLYIRLKGNNEISFNKNILAGTAAYYSNQSNTKIKKMSDNNYFNAPNFTASAVDKSINDTGTFTTLDPGFKNAAEGDFTVSNEALKDNTIGDPRWLK